MFKKALHGTGRTLEIGHQQDGDSCGICVINSIEHHMFGTALFTHDKRNTHRAYYFRKAVEFLLDKVRIRSFPQNNNTHFDCYTQSSADNSTSTSEQPTPIVEMLQDISLYTVDEAKGQEEEEMEIEIDGVSNPGSCEIRTESTPPSPAPSISPGDDVHPPPETVLKRKHRSSLDVEGSSRGTGKYRRVKETAVGTDADDESCEERGESRSAVASRKLKESLKSGEFAVDEQKRTSFERKCEQMGAGVRFRYGEKWEVLHQKCGNWLVMAEPYNTTRFKAHLGSCKAKGTKGRNGCIDDFFRPRAESAGVGASKSTKRPIVTARRRVIVGGHSSGSDPKALPIIGGSLPCLGLREDHNNLIPKYISRALTEGGGSRSETHVAGELFGGGTRYSKLGDKDKQLVQASQLHSRAWTINRELQAIYSTCNSIWFPGDPGRRYSCFTTSHARHGGRQCRYYEHRLGTGTSG